MPIVGDINVTILFAAMVYVNIEAGKSRAAVSPAILIDLDRGETFDSLVREDLTSTRCMNHVNPRVFERFDGWVSRE